MVITLMVCLTWLLTTLVVSATIAQVVRQVCETQRHRQAGEHFLLREAACRYRHWT